MMTWAKAVFLSCWAFVLPIKPLMISATVITLLDLMTGVLAARKRAESITWAQIWRTGTKIIVYSVSILASYVVEKSLLSGTLPVTRLVAITIGAVELRSVLGNSSAAIGQDIFSAIVARLGAPASTPKTAEIPKGDPQS